MDLQINEYFVKRKLQPTLSELLNRISRPVDADEKGTYLKKLLIPQPLTPFEREKFETDYFLGVQPEYRPFTDPGEAKYRDYLLSELEAYISENITLFGTSERMQNILLPTEDYNFETSPRMQRQLNNLTYRIANNLEKKIIKEKTGEKNKTEKENLENGKLKLVEINGKEQIISEEDLEKVPEGPVIVPFVEPGLKEKLRTAGVATGQTAETKTESSVSEIRVAFKESQLESMREILEKAGLGVIQLEVIGDKINGIVQDANMQELAVEIDLLAANDDLNKFKFTFNDPVKDVSDDKYYSSRHFYLSQDDLQKKFLANNERQPAEKIYLDLPESAKFKGSEVPAPEIPEEETALAAGIPLAVEKPKVVPGELPEKAAQGAPGAGAPEGVVPGEIPEMTPVQEPPRGVIAVSERKGKKIKKVMPGKKRRKIAGKPSIREKKEKMAQRERVGLQRQQAAQQAAAQQQAAQQQMAMQQQQAAKKQQRKRMIWLGALAGGTATAGPFAGLLAALTAASSQPDAAEKGVTFILHCIGTSCFC